MRDPRLSAVRDALAKLDPSDVEGKAALWRDGYRLLLGYTLHGMHQIAVDHDLGLATAANWLHPFDITEPEQTFGEPVPAIELRATKFYRGYSIGIKCSQASDGWHYVIKADAGLEHVVFEAADGPFPSMEDAYRTAMSDCVNAIEGIAE